jgi:Holliday junction resolvase RusA-like endonuclease
MTMDARLDPIDMNPQRVAFFVRGRPQPAGSKRAFPIRRKEGGGWIATGKVAVVDDNPKAKGWQAEVAYAGVLAMEAIGATVPWDGPLGLAVRFTLRRPKGHFGTGRNARNLKASAAPWPTTKPDASKLLRAIEDALTGVVWTDDAQVVEQLATKRYGEPEGAHVEVWKL